MVILWYRYDSLLNKTKAIICIAKSLHDEGVLSQNINLQSSFDGERLTLK
jgi:hypothetical protein